LLQPFGTDTLGYRCPLEWVAMIYNVRHRTTFQYQQAVSVSQHVLHLMPRDSTRQRRLEFDLDCDPEPTLISLSADYFGNWRHHLAFEQSHDELVIESRSKVEVAEEPALGSATIPAWEDVAALSQLHQIAPDVAQYCFDSPYVPAESEAFEYAVSSFPPGRPIVEAVTELTSRIFQDFEYRPGVSDVSTPVLEVMATRSGVCQDFAHLEIACLRSLGLPARYVSGYLLTHPPEGQTKLVGSDASHAWLSVWCGEAGWLDFDPTNDIMPQSEHVTVGWGRDYGDVSPVNGFIIGGGSHQVVVAVDVTPVEAEIAAVAG
ncbi:MAG: transglutaminase family protein, partial [Gammaproteobacteria bacterium]|nr:transglutaminase family protein [Gammaproteobacteria bacterium]